MKVRLRYSIEQRDEDGRRIVLLRGAVGIVDKDEPLAEDDVEPSNGLLVWAKFARAFIREKDGSSRLLPSYHTGVEAKALELIEEEED